MSYEIPQQLEYKEKIMFGLTFKQLAYALLFGIPSLLIFLKTNFSIFIKFLIIAILIGTSCLFMFFDFFAYLKNLHSWLLFREFKITDKKMKSFIGVKKIKDGVVYAE